MARIRTIKPEFFTSLAVASLELPARLTFIGLWTHCDDLGRCVDEARLIKAALWPLDDRTAADVERDLCALGKVSLIVRYEVGGRRYLAVCGWSEHQRINRPTPSKIPAPPSPRDPHGGLTEDSVRTQSDAEGDVREPSRQGEMSVSPESGAPAALNTPASTNAALDPALNCTNELRESSVSPHGAVTEDSLPERKGTGNRERNREQGTGTLVTAVGGLTDRNAREENSAPSAQPGNFFARSVITGVPRYRDAPGWAKKQNLVPMASAALDAGFSREAITRYAEMVIAEARFLDHQHIPEFREALRRLARDAAQDQLCRACADPTCSCPTPAAPDRPWTVDDAAELERALDYLGVTAADLDTTGTP